MAGPTQRGSRGLGRSPRRDSSGTSEAAFAAAPGDVVTKARKTSRRRADTSTRPTAGDSLVTRTTFRLLLQRGLAPAEAADLTAFMCGIPVGEAHWSLQQV